MSNHISCSTAMNPSNMANSVMTNLEPIRFDSVALPAPSVATDADWTARLPVLKGRRMMLRELVKTDALSLLSMLSAEEVSRFISPPPTTPEGFEKFVVWAQRERQAVRIRPQAIEPSTSRRGRRLLRPRRRRCGLAPLKFSCPVVRRVNRTMLRP